MPWVIPIKRTSLSKLTRFSKFKDIADSPYFSLQERKKHVATGTSTTTGKNSLTAAAAVKIRPNYRIITKGIYPYYEIAIGNDLDELKNVCWAYITKTLPDLIPPHLDSKAKSKWFIAHFTQVALEAEGEGVGGEVVEDRSDDEEDPNQNQTNLNNPNPNSANVAASLSVGTGSFNNFNNVPSSPVLGSNKLNNNNNNNNNNGPTNGPISNAVDGDHEDEELNHVNPPNNPNNSINNGADSSDFDDDHPQANNNNSNAIINSIVPSTSGNTINNQSNAKEVKEKKSKLKIASESTPLNSNNSHHNLAPQNTASDIQNLNDQIDSDDSAPNIHHNHINSSVNNSVSVANTIKNDLHDSSNNHGQVNISTASVQSTPPLGGNPRRGSDPIVNPLNSESLPSLPASVVNSVGNGNDTSHRRSASSSIGLLNTQNTSPVVASHTLVNSNIPSSVTMNTNTPSSPSFPRARSQSHAIPQSAIAMAHHSNASLNPLLSDLLSNNSVGSSYAGVNGNSSGGSNSDTIEEEPNSFDNANTNANAIGGSSISRSVDVNNNSTVTNNPSSPLLGSSPNSSLGSNTPPNSNSINSLSLNVLTPIPSGSAPSNQVPLTVTVSSSSGSPVLAHDNNFPSKLSPHSHLSLDNANQVTSSHSHSHNPHNSNQQNRGDLYDMTSDSDGQGLRSSTLPRSQLNTNLANQQYNLSSPSNSSVNVPQQLKRRFSRYSSNVEFVSHTEDESDHDHNNTRSRSHSRSQRKHAPAYQESNPIASKRYDDILNTTSNPFSYLSNLSGYIDPIALGLPLIPRESLLTLRGLQTWLIVSTSFTIFSILLRDASLSSFLVYLSVMNLIIFMVLMKGTPCTLSIVLESFDKHSNENNISQNSHSSTRSNPNKSRQSDQSTFSTSGPIHSTPNPNSTAIPHYGNTLPVPPVNFTHHRSTPSQNVLNSASSNNHMITSSNVMSSENDEHEHTSYSSHINKDRSSQHSSLTSPSDLTSNAITPGTTLLLSSSTHSNHLNSPESSLSMGTTGPSPLLSPSASQNASGHLSTSPFPFPSNSVNPSLSSLSSSTKTRIPLGITGVMATTNPTVSGTMSVSDIDPKSFVVREVGYKLSKKKSSSASAQYYLSVGVDIFTCETKIRNISQHLALPETFYSTNNNGSGGLGSSPLGDSGRDNLFDPSTNVPDFLVFHFMMPSYPPPNLLWGKASVEDGPGWSVVFYHKLNPLVRDELIKESTPAAKLWKKFVYDCSNPEMGDRLKCIPRVNNINELSLSWTLASMMKKANNKPFLTRPQHEFYKGPGWMVIDIDVHRFSYPARLGANNFISLVTRLVTHIGFVIEGKEDDELPEQVITAIEMAYLQVDGAKSLEWWKQKLQKENRLA